jgi:hypothetical protein
MRFAHDPATLGGRVGSVGDDILIGGLTAFDDAASNPDSEAALPAILTEWSSAQDYLTWVNSLVNGGGRNGSYTLTAGVTVYDDGGVDVLDGGPGRDLFFAGLEDMVKDRQPNDSIFPL